MPRRERADRQLLDAQAGRQPRRAAVKLRYLGTAKNNAWLKNRTAALNLRNLIGRGLNRASGAWMLA